MTKHTNLIARLRHMSDRTARHHYDIGDYWNACDDAADALAAQLEQIEHERTDLALVIDSSRAMQEEIDRLNFKLEGHEVAERDEIMAVLAVAKYLAQRDGTSEKFLREFIIKAIEGTND